MEICKIFFILVSLAILTSSENADEDDSEGNINCRNVKRKNSEEKAPQNNNKIKKDSIDEDFYDEEPNERPIKLQKYFQMRKQTEDLWKEYKKKHNLEFTKEEEEQKSKEIYNQNLNLLLKQQFNKNITFEIGENEFFHLNFEMFQEEKCGTKVPEKMLTRKRKIQRFFSIPIPNSLSYTHLMQPIQNQGSCGCCWAFATISLIEAAMKRKNSTFQTVLSQSYLVDCDKYNSGCLGGWPPTAIGKI